MIKRGSGILMHVSSIPSPYGIGTLGRAAYQFIDFLKKAGQSYWQVLPLSPTGFGNSPYQAFSSYAGNPYFIDLDLLCQWKLLYKSDYDKIDFGNDNKKVDYQKISQNKLKVLEIAYHRGKGQLSSEIKKFKKDNIGWIEDYGLFMAIKVKNQLRPWQKWEEDIKYRKPQTIKHLKKHYAEDINFWIFLQYIFYRQWKDLKVYGNNNGIKIIGDLPIYVALDSVDTWINPQYFNLDKNLAPITLGGCPPDEFSPKGQFWGNPVYRWDNIEGDNFKWWLDRIKISLELYDVLRLDHFRGFESYWEIPTGEINAEKGRWVKGPGTKLFHTIEETLGKIDIIAEDLGFITPEVIQLRKDCNYPGMKILQFAFDSHRDNPYLPHNYNKDCVVYTGTHDNDTIMGWLQSSNEEQKKYIKNYLKISELEGDNWGIIRGAWTSVANLAIAPMQDFLGLDSQGRMNTPSTIENNWQWRMQHQGLSDHLAKKIFDLTNLYGRLGQ